MVCSMSGGIWIRRPGRGKKFCSSEKAPDAPDARSLRRPSWDVVRLLVGHVSTTLNRRQSYRIVVVVVVCLKERIYRVLRRLWKCRCSWCNPNPEGHGCCHHSHEGRLIFVHTDLSKSVNASLRLHSPCHAICKDAQSRQWSPVCV